MVTFQLLWKVRLQGSFEVGVFNEFPEIGWMVFDGLQDWTAATKSRKGATHYRIRQFVLIRYHEIT